jgi:Protein of unknown function (DUF3313)
MKNKLATVFVTMLLIAGSAWAQDSQEGAPQFSGFLSDYSKLQPATDREGIWLSLNKTADYSGYKKIMFDPIEIYVTPNPDYKGVQPDVLKRMTDGFYASFLATLTPDYQIVHEGGPDVLRVRAAITGVQLVKPPLKPTDFIPVKAVFNLGQSATGNAPIVAEMTAEMEILDPDGKRLAAAVANRKGSKTLKQGDQVTWEDLQSITDYWAKGFRQRLDQLRDVPH